MKLIWNRVDNLNINGTEKNSIFVTIMVLINMITGAAVWGIAGRFIFPEIYGLICFMGCPAEFVGIFGSLLYLYNHEFT